MALTLYNHFPKTEHRPDLTEQHDTLFFEPEKALDLLEPERRKAVTSWLDGSADREKDIRQLAVGGYLADTYGESDPPEERREFLKGQYAKQFFGAPDGAHLDDDTFFGLVKDQRQFAKQERALLNAPATEEIIYDDVSQPASPGGLQQRAAVAALSGEPLLPVIGQWHKDVAGKPGYRDTPDALVLYDKQARKTYAAIQARMGEVAPLVGTIMQGLTTERDKPGSYGGDQLVDALMQLPAENRQLALALVGQRLSKAVEGTEGQAAQVKFWQSFARGSGNMLTGTARTWSMDDLEETESLINGLKPGDEIGGRFAKRGDKPGDALMRVEGSSGRGMETDALLWLTEPLNQNHIVTQEDIDAARAEVKKQRERLAIGIQLEQIGQGILDPVKSKTVWQKVVNGFAGSVAPQVAMFAATRRIAPVGASAPAALQMASGAGSIPLMFGMMADQNAQQLMQQNPGMDIGQAYKLGRRASYIQTGLEQAQMMLGLGLVGKGKALGQELLRMKGSAWATFGKSFGANVVGQNVIEGVQDITPQTVQAISSALDKDIPGVNWQKALNGKDGFWAQREDTFWAVLPLAIFGAGGKTIRAKVGEAQYTALAQSMTDTLLHAAGIPAEARAAVLAETDSVKRLDAFSAAPKDKATAEEGAARLNTEMREQAAAADEMMKEAGVTVEPVNRDGAPVYRVTRHGREDAPAVVTEHGSVADAQAAVTDHLGESLRGRMAGYKQVADAMVVQMNEIVADNAGRGEKTELKLSGKYLKSTGGQVFEVKPIAKGGTDAVPFEMEADSLTNLQDEMKAAGMAAGTVLGANRALFDDAGKLVGRAYTFNRGAGPDTVLHERVESLIRTGHVSDRQIWEASIALSEVPGFDPAKMDPKRDAGRHRLATNLQRIALKDDSLTPAERRETLVELVVADKLGQFKDGTALEPGSLWEAIKLAAVTTPATTPAGKALSALKSLVKALRAYLETLFKVAHSIRKARASGQIKKGDAWDTFAMKLLGLSEQTEHNRAVVKDVGIDTGEAFSIKAGMSSADGAAQADSDSQGGSSDADYRGEHGAPDSDSAPAYDLTGNGVYPADVYQRPDWYETDDGLAEMYKIQRLRGNPDAPVWIHRAIPIAVYDNLHVRAKAEGLSFLKLAIRPGDWVSTSKKYAKDHGESALRGEFKVVGMRVKARDIHTNGDSIFEWGYNPPSEQSAAPADGAETFSLVGEGRLDSIADSLQRSGIPPKKRMAMMQAAADQVRGMARAMEHNDSQRVALTDPAEANDEAINELNSRTETERSVAGDASAAAVRELKAAQESEADDLRAAHELEAGGARDEGWNADRMDALNVRHRRERESLAARQRAAVVKIETEGKREMAAITARGRREVAILRQKQASEDTADREQAAREDARNEQYRSLVILDAILMNFPAEVRGKVGGFVKLSTLQTDKARAAFIEGRVEKLGKVLENYLVEEYTEKIGDVMDKAEPKSKAGEKPVGHLGAETHTWFDGVRAAMAMDKPAASNRMEEIEGRMGSETLTEEEGEALAQEYMRLVAFGGMESRTASELYSIYSDVSDAYDRGKEAWSVQQEALAKQWAEWKDVAVEEVGLTGSISDQIKGGATLAKQWGKTAVGRLIPSTYEQDLQRIFGLDSKTAARMVQQAREATRTERAGILAKEAAWREFKRRILPFKNLPAWKREVARMKWQNNFIEPKPDAVRLLEGVKTETLDVPVETLGKILAGEADAKTLGLTRAEVDTLTEQFENLPDNSRRKFLTLERHTGGTETVVSMSEAEAAHFLTMWGQEAYRPNLRLAGMNETAIEDMRAMVTPEGRAVLDYILGDYRDGWAAINAVFMPLAGIRLPQNENYAPGHFETANETRAMALEGPGVQNGNLTSGPLRSRKHHKAPPRIDGERRSINILTVYWNQIAQMEHWKAWAPAIRDAKQVVNSVKVKSAIKAKHGNDAVATLRGWIEQHENGGLASGYENMQQASFMNRLLRARAYGKLAGKIGVLAVQWTAGIASLLDLPFRAGLKSFGRAITGQAIINLPEMIKHPVVQNRYKAGGSPALRLTKSGRIDKKGGYVSYGMDLSMEPVGAVDAFWTALSAVTAYDAHYRSVFNGSNHADAAAFAEEQMQATVERTAQPVEGMEKSLNENKASVWWRMLTLFSSDPRQKVALELNAVRHAMRGDGKWADAAKIAFYTHVVMGSMAWLVRGLIHDATRDDDDEDEEGGDSAWEAENWLLAVALGPYSGLPIVGDAIGLVVRHVAGLRNFGGDTPLAENVEAVLTVNRLFNDPPIGEEAEAYWKIMSRAIHGMAEAVGGNAAAISVAGNVADQVAGAWDNLNTTELERGKNALEAKERAKPEKSDAEKAAAKKKSREKKEAEIRRAAQ